MTDAGAANTFFDAAGSPINGNSNGGVDPQYHDLHPQLAQLTCIGDRSPPGERIPRCWSSSLPARCSGRHHLPRCLRFRELGRRLDQAQRFRIADSVNRLQRRRSSVRRRRQRRHLRHAGSHRGPASTGLGFSCWARERNVSRDRNLFEPASTPRPASSTSARCGQTMVQKVGGNVTLTVPVEKSTGLNTWAPAGTMSPRHHSPGDP